MDTHNYLANLNNNQKKLNKYRKRFVIFKHNKINATQNYSNKVFNQSTLSWAYQSITQRQNAEGNHSSRVT